MDEEEEVKKGSLTLTPVAMMAATIRCQVS